MSLRTATVKDTRSILSFGASRRQVKGYVNRSEADHSLGHSKKIRYYGRWISNLPLVTSKTFT
jgi:hypothetical protein